MLKNQENNGTEEIGIVTPTPSLTCFSHAIYLSTPVDSMIDNRYHVEYGGQLSPCFFSQYDLYIT